MVHDFKKSIIVGQEGEEIIKNYLRNNPKVKGFDDVSNVERYQNRDIDLIVDFMDGTAVVVEVKTDTYTSGNIFYETMSNMECGVVGCMVKSKADYLFYYFTETRELYIMDFEKYRAWFRANKYRFSRKLLKNIDKKRTGTYTSEGYTIPKKFLEADFKGYKKVILWRYKKWFYIYTLLRIEVECIFHFWKEML